MFGVRFVVANELSFHPSMMSKSKCESLINVPKVVKR
jgi:hypothetical protein